MDKQNLKKEYSNGEITVIWQSGLCIHAGRCVKHLPEVFRPKESPWVQLNGADSPAIREAVSKCPSGALSIRESGGIQES